MDGRAGRTESASARDDGGDDGADEREIARKPKKNDERRVKDGRIAAKDDKGYHRQRHKSAPAAGKERREGKDDEDERKGVGKHTTRIEWQMKLKRCDDR